MCSLNCIPLPPDLRFLASSFHPQTLLAGWRFWLPPPPAEAATFRAKENLVNTCDRYVDKRTFAHGTYDVTVGNKPESHGVRSTLGCTLA